MLTPVPSTTKVVVVLGRCRPSGLSIIFPLRNGYGKGNGGSFLYLPLVDPVQRSCLEGFSFDEAPGGSSQHLPAPEIKVRPDKPYTPTEPRKDIP